MLLDKSITRVNIIIDFLVYIQRTRLSLTFISTYFYLPIESAKKRPFSYFVFNACQLSKSE